MRMGRGMESSYFRAKTHSRCCDASFQSMTLKTSKSTSALTRLAMRRRSSSRSRMAVSSRLTSWSRASVRPCSGRLVKTDAGTGSASPTAGKPPSFQNSSMECDLGCAKIDHEQLASVCDKAGLARRDTVAGDELDEIAEDFLDGSRGGEVRRRAKEAGGEGLRFGVVCMGDR